ncbi:adenine deaminase C-terminal domain-containing protein [Halalkalicoccus subterraneus]|uniref:adenine deaminase C-terminal domain-containing protein n=1 Tax=Halalkalicoccus subterraneus TaxID=2675002 RepID=UPI000EFCE024|nr:adenine deaminase C-terminal domain-containing protein [Halalkalicoccus subterraneus]
MNDLQPVALEAEPADLVVAGGRVLLPELGEFQSRDVAVVNNRVAALPEDADPVIGPDTEVLGANGQAVVPGFIDAHTHLDLFQCYELAYHHSLEGGTTTVISECSGFGAFGPQGIEEFLVASAYLPVTVRAALSPVGLFDTFEPPLTTGEEASQLIDLLDDDRVVGVGETDWIHAVGRDTPAEALYERARELGKPVTGHAAGCRGGKLTAFSSIIDNDHEAISREEVIERAENGLHVVGRCGSVRDDIEALAAAIDRVDPAECSLSTDGLWPRDLTDGHMDRVVRRAIEAGIAPTDAIRMATLSPARHFGLDDRGSLAPGSVADIVVLSDIEEVRVKTVISGGEVVVRHGSATVGPRNREYPAEFYDSVSLSVSPETFSVPASEGVARAISVEEGLLTGETCVSPPSEDVQFRPDPERGVLKAALLDRRPGEDGGFTGFLTGYGLESGAAATSLTWERPGVAVVGADEHEMARAAARVAEMGGGWAVADDGIVAELPLRVGGTCSDLDVEETATLIGTVESALRARGVTVENPLLTVQTLSFPGVPSLKLSFSGYADVLDREIVGVQ